MTDAGLVNENKVKVTLELQTDGESLIGRVVGPDDTPREFSGWIGLVGVIDGLLASGITSPDSESVTE